MIPPNIRLSHYKREDVRKSIVREAEHKEVGIQFDDHFGQRPDTLSYEADVLQLAKQGATSFHASQEKWSNPLQLQTGMNRKELDELRIGWDLILDIDCPTLELSKLIAVSLIAALKRDKVISVSVKYSGNRGFHIGIPWEAFPHTVGGTEVSKEFPEFPKRIIDYIINVVEQHILSIDGEMISFAGIKKDRKTVAEWAGISEKELIVQECSVHHIKVRSSSGEKRVFICKNCTKEFSSALIECTNCHSKFIKEELREVKAEGHCGCESIKFKHVLDVKRILNLDAILLSSRHMYRMAYSLHEKTSRISIPINPDNVADFNVDTSEQNNFEFGNYKFLDRTQSKGDAEELLKKALDFSFVAKTEEKKEKEYEIPEDAIPEELFPACIKKILEGMDDGKKRSLFILTNFLGSCGWSSEAIEKLVKEWNQKNKEPLREVYIVSQLRYHKQHGTKIPPNCNNEAYYKDLAVKCSEEICSKVRNPLVFSKRKVRDKK